MLENIDTCVFDRNGRLYHGVVKSIADGAPRPVSSSGESVDKPEKEIETAIATGIETMGTSRS